ncbi:hypothetical protein ACB092_10G099600 [Castanea dentata]
MFTEEDVNFPENLDNLMPCCISEEENMVLNRIPMPEEIKEALFRMQDLKAPSPDGFPALFYNEFGPIVGNAVIQAVIEFFENGSMPANGSLIIISKLLVAKLRPLLHKIISPCQSAFIPGRWIAENQVLVHELLHSFKTRKVKTKKLMVKKIMEKMGFNDKWVNLMMQCITTVTYSVRINGKPRGDPISPFLFLFCAVGLSALLNQATSIGILKGVSACPRGPQISHIFFANDKKTALFFSRNTPQDMQEEIKNHFGAEVIHQHETYLGLSSLVGRSKQNTFRALKEKLDNKLSGWKEKLLSQAGKEVLVKAVVQAIPTYTKSVFKLSDSLCDDMTGMIRRFCWEKMCAPKEKSGLALLAKQGWRLQNNSHSLVHRVLKARYFPNTDFLHAELGTKPSYAWRSILSAQPVLKAGYRWQLPRPSTFRVLLPPTILPEDTKVSFLIDSNSGEWNVSLISQIFPPDDVACILGIPLSEHKPRDRIIWAYTPKGKFTVNSAYKVAMSMTQGNSDAEVSYSEPQTRFWRQVWNLHILNKIKLFTWRACKNILPTKANLYHRHVLDNSTCDACNLDPETTGHLFWDFHLAKEVWTLADLPFDRTGVRYRDFMDFLWHLFFTQHVGTEIIELTVTTAWSIWFDRNKTRLGAARQSPRDILVRAQAILEEYQLAHQRPSKFKEVVDSRWTPPNFPWYKTNVDAAVFPHLGMIGVGVIIRDHGGSVVAAMSKRMSLALGPLEAEAKAMDEATMFARDINGAQDVIFESDSSILCHALADPTNAPISISIIVAGTRFRLHEFRTFETLHVRRQAN